MLFDSLKIRSIRFKNRIAISPMCQFRRLMDSQMTGTSFI
jgi:2,4-dienoyl-CoA reductase-like NADH-dependent reductase (Old Yellow Enzyme family)